jgi:hypothetical protein
MLGWSKTVIACGIMLGFSLMQRTGSGTRFPERWPLNNLRRHNA